MSNLCDFSQSGRSRIGEAFLWAAATATMLSVHAGAAMYMMQPVPPKQASDGPPPAFMIEMAALPEALNVEEVVEANDVVDSAEVKQEPIAPVEDVPPPEPEPEPVEEVAEPDPVELPEPIEEIDPIENQMMASLENVEVPLPVFRPPPPPKEEKKVVEQKKPEKKKVEQPKPRPPAAKAAETAKANVTQSNRSVAAASGNSSGAPSKEIARYGDKVRAAVARRKPRNLRTKNGSVSVRFNVTPSGSLSGVSLLSSSGNSSDDQKVLAAVSRVSVEPPPPGAKTAYDVTFKIE